MPPVFHLLIAAQCISALADNALLIVTIALLQQSGLPAWWAPMLKVGFIASYVVLAPFVGPLADAFPKARLMACMNAVKLAGVLALLCGLSPLAAFAIVGLGAAAYAPAKYGLATELVGPAHLVRANGWIEVTAVCAVLFGTGLGGLLVSPLALQLGAVAGAPLRVGAPSLLAVVALYVVSGLLNLGIRDSGVRRAVGSIHPLALLRDFVAANRLLWRDREGGLSLAVTTLFWGVGATLQFAVLRWANERMHLALDEAALVQAAVAFGVILGAVVAGLFVPLARARRMLLAGVAFGLLMVVVAFTETLVPAVALLMTVGGVGGLMVVPLNALLQHRGVVLLSPGRSIAVQGANENASVLAFLGVYAGLVALDVPLTALLVGLGLVVALALLALILKEEARDRREAGLHAPWESPQPGP
jgi:LPLT family lysophospholipid transporter-like MFS transporter